MHIETIAFWRRVFNYIRKEYERSLKNNDNKRP